MNKSVLIAVAGLVGIVVGLVLAESTSPRYAGDAGQPASRSRSAPGFAAVPGLVGGQDQTGPYEVVPDWPKPLAQLPGHEDWTWGAVQGIFAESPDRVYILLRGELPVLERPQEVPYPGVGPSLSYPVSATPFRNASVGPVTSPGNSGSDGWNELAGHPWRGCPLGALPDRSGCGWQHYRGVDSVGLHLQTTPLHYAINPYDPEKHVWVVDDRQHAVYKFSNDGQQPGSDIGHSRRAGY